MNNHEIIYKILGICFVLFFIIAGFVLVFGAKKRWPMLVDPAEGLWLIYSQAFIKKLFGKKFLIYFTYFLGLSFICCGIIALWNSLK